MNSDFNHCNNFELSWVDKITTRTVAVALYITQFADQVRMRLILQSIIRISRVLQKLIKYFNGTIILTAFPPLFPVESVIFCLYFNGALLNGTLSRTLPSVKAETNSA